MWTLLFTVALPPPPEYSLEGLMLKLKLQYFGHLMPRADSLEKTLMLRKIEGRRRRGQQRTRWLDSITDSMDMYLSNIQDTVKDREAWHAVYGVAKSQTQISDWTAATSPPHVSPRLSSDSNSSWTSPALHSPPPASSWVQGSPLCSDSMVKTAQHNGCQSRPWHQSPAVLFIICELLSEPVFLCVKCGTNFTGEL